MQTKARWLTMLLVTITFFVFLAAVPISAAGAAEYGPWEKVFSQEGLTAYDEEYIGFAGVCYGNGKYVAVGNQTYYGDIFTSTDGKTWTALEPWSRVAFRGVKFLNGKFYAYGNWRNVDEMWMPYYSRIWESTDGVNWQLAYSSIVEGNPQWGVCSLAYGEGKFVAAINSRIYTSIDNLNTFTKTGADEQYGLFEVAYGNGAFVAAGWVGGSWTVDMVHSPDGVNWTTLKEPAANFVQFVNGGFVAGSNNGLKTSPDGITWRQAPNGRGSSIAFGNGVYLIPTHADIRCAKDLEKGFTVNFTGDLGGQTWEKLSDAAAGAGGFAVVGGPNIYYCSFGDVTCEAAEEPKAIEEPKAAEEPEEIDSTNDTGAGYTGKISFAGKLMGALTPGAGDRYGSAMAADGSRLVIGAPGQGRNYNGGPENGAVYVYTLLNGNWSLEARLMPAVPAPRGSFGRAVDIAGDMIAVGAPDENNGGNTWAGAVYVFKKIGGTWVQTHRLTPSDGVFESQFGTSVTIDNRRIVAGALGRNQGGTGSNFWSGRAYAFDYDSGSGTWRETVIYNPQQGADDYFGCNVSLAGGALLVSSPHGVSHDRPATGEAHIFNYAEANKSWHVRQGLFPAVALQHGDSFGGASLLAGGGNEAVVGGIVQNSGGSAGRVYVFRHDGTNWSQSQELAPADLSAGDSFGSALAVGGNTLLVSAPGRKAGQADNAGAVYLYEKNGPAWKQGSLLISPTPAGDEGFGGSLAVSGGWVFVGAPGSTGRQGVVYIYHNNAAGAIAVTGQYTITAAAAPAAGGTTSGGGIYHQGAGVVLNAAPKPGYRFVNWTENGVPVSAAATYSFNAGGHRTLTANFAVIPAPPAAPQNAAGITVYIDQQPLQSDVPPMLLNDRTMVPLRAIFEALGIEVTWLPESSTIIGAKDNVRIQLVVDSNLALVNDAEITLDVPATIVNDRTLVPVRFIAESTGQVVEWDGETQTVYIKTIAP